MNADAVAALLNEGVEAFRLTREYVGEDLLPPLPGWSWFDWCEKAEAALAAAPLPSEPESVYDFAWLIETGQPPRWYGSWATGRDPWTTDATLAVRFPDKADAEAFIAAKDIAGIAVEHGFRRAAPLPSDTPADGLDVERRRSMKKQGRSTFLLMSEFEQLEEWCRLVRTVFDGETPFLVGSVHSKPTFRDVDLRLILPDAAFDDAWRDPVKVRLMNRAISVWGQQETSLPIDFQIQRMTEANEQFGGEFRNPMGVRDWTAIPTSGIPRPDTDQEDRP